MAHFIGNEGDASTAGGKRPSPQPSPMKGEGASLSVLQFVAIARGEWAVQVPRNAFRAEAVVEEQRYCLGCFGLRWFDVIRGCQVSGAPQGGGARCQVLVCRCCGASKEVIR
jgi:hypothetical protein